MLKVKLKTNFSFVRVSRGFHQLWNVLIDDVADNMSKNIKNNLVNSDSLYKPLAKGTIRARKRGKYWGKERVSPTDSRTPLIQTGSLLDSIKHNKEENSITLNHYGWHHNTGFTAGGAKVPRRPFISEVAKPSFKKFYRTFRRMLKKVGK